MDAHAELLAQAETLTAGASCSRDHAGLRLTVRRFLTHWWAVSGVRIADGRTLAQMSGAEPESLLRAILAEPNVRALL